MKDSLQNILARVDDLVAKGAHGRALELLNGIADTAGTDPRVTGRLTALRTVMRAGPPRSGPSTEPPWPIESIRRLSSSRQNAKLK